MLVLMSVPHANKPILNMDTRKQRTSPLAVLCTKRNQSEEKKTGTNMSKAKHKALLKSINAGTGRLLSKAEQRLKTKDWPKAKKGGSVAWPETHKQKSEHQKQFGRAWND